ncbi:hypothetical protein [Aliivibrio kagoshimensis]|uniref:hypothetical protein n=1 Tax=Aliivibrio kagoshimensis TaxID=2910230 RepID=UPI003D1015CA
MNKLLNLKEWLTLDEAASYLSSVFDKPILITDLYRLALDNNLTLSARFLEPVPALTGKLVDDDEFFTPISDENTDESHCDSDGLFTLIDTLDSSEEVDDDTWFIYEDIAHNINGIWDLTMIGLESVDIEKRYLDELGECGYNPQRYNEQGVFVRNDTEVCKLLHKLVPSPVYEDKAFVGDIIKNFLVSNEICFDECVDHDFDTLASLLTPSERDHVTAMIDLMSVSFPTDKVYKNCLTIENYNYQMVIKKHEMDRFIQSLEEMLQEPIPQEAILVPDEDRTTLLILIEVLCNKVNVDPKQRGITSSLIAMIGLIGASLNDDTIREILNQIEPVVCSKYKEKLKKIVMAKERNSFLVLIAALCKEANLDYKQRGSVAVLVEMTKLNGTPLLNDKIGEILSQIETAICSKSK